MREASPDGITPFNYGLPATLPYHPLTTAAGRNNLYSISDYREIEKMPIFEFKCIQCNEVFEFLFLSEEDKKEMKCPKCSSEDLERVMSTTNFSVKGSSSATSQPSMSCRTCGSGSCGTIEIPGRGD